MSLYLWSNDHLCFILEASRKTGAIPHVVAEVLSRLSGYVTGSVIASGIGRSVFHSRGVTDLLPDRGPSLWGLAQLYIYLCTGLLKPGWSDVHKLMLINADLVPKHGTEWTCLVKSSGVC